MSFSVDETGLVFDYGTSVQPISTTDGIRMLGWLNREVGDMNVVWGICYHKTGLQFWFRNQDDFVRFMLTWWA
jgi:hypothetical protein